MDPPAPGDAAIYRGPGLHRRGCRRAFPPFPPFRLPGTMQARVPSSLPSWKSARSGMPSKPDSPRRENQALRGASGSGHISPPTRTSCPVTRSKFRKRPRALAAGVSGSGHYARGLLRKGFSHTVYLSPDEYAVTARAAPSQRRKFQAPAIRGNGSAGFSTNGNLGATEGTLFRERQPYRQRRSCITSPVPGCCISFQPAVPISPRWPFFPSCCWDFSASTGAPYSSCWD